MLHRIGRWYTINRGINSQIRQLQYIKSPRMNYGRAILIPNGIISFLTIMLSCTGIAYEISNSKLEPSPMKV